MSIRSFLADAFEAARKSFFPTPQELENERIDREISHNKQALTLAVQGFKLEKIEDYRHVSVAAGMMGVAGVIHYPVYSRVPLADSEKQPEIDRIKKALRDLSVSENTILSVEENARRAPSQHGYDYM
ncbi:MAG: hypothetical protein ACK4VI_06510 [Alphaproteobacteria bacterium]